MMVVMKVREYDWIYYGGMGREINYIRDYMDSHIDDDMNMMRLGLVRDSDESKREKYRRKKIDDISRRGMNGFDTGEANSISGARKLMDLTYSMEERLKKYGKLNNDGPETADPKATVDQFAQELERAWNHDSRYIDYYMVKGDIDTLKKNKYYMYRCELVKHKESQYVDPLQKEIMDQHRKPTHNPQAYPHLSSSKRHNNT